MSLSYSNIAGTNGNDSTQIAKDGDQVIYYIDDSVDKLRELDDNEAEDLIIELVDDAVADLRLVNLTTKKLVDVDGDIMANEPPRDRYSKRVFSDVKNRLAQMESKYYRARHGLQVIPRNLPTLNDRYYVFGMSGCGKSTWCSNYALAWSSEHTGQPVYIFSRKTCDPAYDGVIPNLVRIILDRGFVHDNSGDSEGEDRIQRYANSLVIFDDFLKIDDKLIRDAAQHLKNSIYELGRQYNTDIISSQHKGLGFSKSITELTESTGIVLFPKLNLGESKKVLEKYLCFSKEQIARILDEESKKERWMCIIRPDIVITEKYIKIID